RLQMHPRDGSVVANPCLEFHQHRMAAPVAVKDLFTRQADLHRTAKHESRLGYDDLMVEGVALATKPAAVRRCDDGDVRRGHLENFRQGTMQVMRSLGAGPDGQLPVRIENCDGRVLLDRQVRVPLIEEGVFKNMVGLGEPFLDVAEFERDALMYVSCV